MKADRPRSDTRLRDQAGAHAVEYALIFPVFFILLYGTLAYGLIFAMRLGLQHAAEEGARAALRYQQPASSGGSQVSQREGEAFTAATAAADWVSGLGSIEVTAEVCLMTNTNCQPVFGADLDDNVACGKTLTDGCQVVVTVAFPYSEHPIFPSIPGFGLLMPDRLQGQARAVLDGRALSPL